MRRRTPNRKAPGFSPPPRRYLLLTARHIGWMVIGGITITFLGWLFFGRVLRVNEVRCQKGSSACDPPILAELDRLKGQSILTGRWQFVSEKLKKADPSILQVRVVPKLPTTLTVFIDVREKVVRLRKLSSGYAYVADQEGFVFTTATETDNSLPEIIVPEKEEIEMGKEIDDPKLNQSVKLAVVLETNFIGFQRIEVQEEAFEVWLTDGIPVLFPQEGDYNKMVTTLQRILSQATIGHRPTKIDIRYTKPVMSY
ncbi:MAG: hypothetical protein A3F04_01725 [Candidatus Chisholmbacteria bacterium RIFCSPHIGHO2_12_FULL_49_9]|uniref:Cell division protein FtsQ/DivIB C-terminal domain-containing protein n=1 Tax=Candidatus Chisholmbacteria bacterium RIFCSPHIGHO2_01_FULL_52_32 TaxID=1797591 RepID=A0A1G1VSR7_9BACT|nr:MAG: hypothetical protein A3F04_01725 [Candidatus Chisholmbacteria bacterium RIFCSPHIGHO2_12_FULL_49_9]OGY18439.1 MAG: hypothetical protein A2786_02985 [Candidatus Chisholmbacteria bacterium RIFCSPHIGHO2_01_FULL_52_32]OGY20190.1 MAG: hypothetical protein A2900_03760 [Candidatus Chisholmbacteria bacterium RIFCSPLOWO2_01_FULL_50_28]